MSALDSLTQLQTHNPLFSTSNRLDTAVFSLFDKEGAVNVLENINFVQSRVGPYLNLDLSDTASAALLNTPYQLPLYSKNTGKLWLEYFSPNAAKQLHIGHIRNIDVGIALHTMSPLFWENVVFDNHLGDWGIQFGILLWSIERLATVEQFDIILNEERQTISTTLELTNPASYYTSVYVWGNQQKEFVPAFDQEVRSVFVRLSGGDPQLQAKWQKILTQCTSAYTREVTLLGMPAPDYTLGESTYEKPLEALLEFLDANRLLQRDGLARYTDFATLNYDEIDATLSSKLGQLIGNSKKEDSKNLGRAYWVSSTGYSTYLSRDIAARIVWARDYEATQTLTITDSGQNHHLNQVIVLCSWLAHQPSFVRFFGEKVCTVLVNQIKHIGYGRLVLPSGKMSTRKGNFVTAGEVLDQSIAFAQTSLESRLHQNPEEITKKSHVIAKAAIKWNNLKHSLEQDITFDLSAILAFEGNTGVYQLYTYARLKSIVGKVVTTSTVLDVSRLNNKEKELLRYIYLTELVIQDSYSAWQPHRLTNWLSKWTQLINSWYATTSITQESDPIRQYTLLCLVNRITECHKICLELLGIDVLESL